MPRIKLLVDFAGDLEGHNCPHAGDVIDVSRRLATRLCDDGTAELSEPVRGRSRRPGGIERAVAQPPEDTAAGPSARDVSA